jgi:chemotaxis protein MotB
MVRTKKHAEPEGEQGAPEWMVTFSDCMTLLLTFFVLLLSFSSFDNRLFPSLKVVYSEALNSITPTPRRSDRDALLYLPPVKYVATIDKGSEKPTLTQSVRESLINEAKLVDRRRDVIFRIPSEQIFWGQGIALSPEGRQIMDIMASLIDNMPGRVVVGESGLTDAEDSEDFGLARAWAVIEYLATQKSLDRGRFSISATTTLTQGSPGRSEPEAGHSESERMVEIILLQRSVYN